MMNPQSHDWKEEMLQNYKLNNTNPQNTVTNSNRFKYVYYR